MKNIFAKAYLHLAILVLSSCASISMVSAVKMNIQIRNLSTKVIDVSYRDGGGILRTEKVFPGQLAQGYDSVVIVKHQRGNIQVMATQFMRENGNRYRRAIMRHTFENAVDAVFEVGVDDLGQTWGVSKDGERLRVTSSPT